MVKVVIILIGNRLSLYINYIDITELRSTGFHHQMLITGASCDFIRGVRQTGLYIYFILLQVL